MHLRWSTWGDACFLGGGSLVTRRLLRGSLLRCSGVCLVGRGRVVHGDRCGLPERLNVRSVLKGNATGGNVSDYRSKSDYCCPTSNFYASSSSRYTRKRKSDSDPPRHRQLFLYWLVPGSNSVIVHQFRRRTLPACRTNQDLTRSASFFLTTTPSAVSRCFLNTFRFLSTMVVVVGGEPEHPGGLFF